MVLVVAENKRSAEENLSETYGLFPSGGYFPF